ncbi:MAG: type IX secretion system membrane protein PorP/SprF, partial [Bacteroidota bacterium]
LTLHAPIVNQHLGLGVAVLNDKIGPTNTTSVNASIAYRMNLSAKSKLALGLSGGINVLQANLNAVDLDVQGDAAFQNNLKNAVTPSVGFGAYYSRERFYAGFSTPDLLQNTYSVSTQSNTSTLIGKEKRHYFLIAGTLVKLGSQLDFKPTTLVKLTPGAPIQADVTASFIISKKILLGAMYRTGDAVGALLGINFTEQLYLGYSYDWSYGLKTGTYNNGSHELMLRYDFIFTDGRQIHSPRYF